MTEKDFRNQYHNEINQINPDHKTLENLAMAMAAQANQQQKQSFSAKIRRPVKIILASGGAAAVIAAAVVLPPLTESSQLTGSDSATKNEAAQDTQSATESTVQGVYSENADGNYEYTITTESAEEIVADEDGAASDAGSGFDTVVTASPAQGTQSTTKGETDSSQTETENAADQDSSFNENSDNGFLCEIIGPDGTGEVTFTELIEFSGNYGGNLPAFDFPFFTKAGTYATLLNIRETPSLYLFAGVYCEDEADVSDLYAVVIHPTDMKAMYASDFIVLFDRQENKLPASGWLDFTTDNFGKAAEDYRKIYF